MLDIPIFQKSRAELDEAVRGTPSFPLPEEVADAPMHTLLHVDDGDARAQLAMGPIVARPDELTPPVRARQERPASQAPTSSRGPI